MKRFLAALFLLIGCVNAQAQCNSPSGFLQAFGSFTLGDVAVLGPDCNHLQDGGAGGGGAQLNVPNTWTATQTFASASGPSVVITPPSGAATYPQALLVTQVGPTTTIAGPVGFNLFNITQQGAVTGTGIDTTGNLTTVSAGLRVNFFAQGTNLAGQANDAILGAVANTVASPSAGDSIGVAGTVYRNVNNGGGMYGLVPYVFLDTGGVTAHFIGIESDVNITTATAGAASNRAAFRAMNAGPHQAGTLDAAYVVGNINAAGGAFQKMFALSGVFGNPPIAPTGDLFFNDQAMTVANVFNMANLTVTGNILNFPHAQITGPGAAFLTSLQVNDTATGSVKLTPSINNTTGVESVDMLTSLGTNELFLATNEPARTATLFGITTGNYAEIVTAGSANLGLLLGTTTGKPIFFGTGNLLAGFVNLNQQWNFGPANVSPNSNIVSTVNANTVTLPGPSFPGTVMQIGGPNAVAARLYLDSFGSNGGFSLRRSDGTAAAPTAVQSGERIASFLFEGAIGNNLYNTTDAAGVVGFAASTFTGSNAQTDIAIVTIPSGSLGPAAEVVRFLGLGNVKFSNAANFSANAAVATALGSLGPAGSHTTVQKWLTIVDNTGATLYVPTF